MRCLIVDDEELARMEMRRLLQAHPGIEITGEAADVATALKLVSSLKPDVIFLDVELRAETGFDLVGRLPEASPRIVFVTAYDKYAVRGFQCNALDYLLKPVDPTLLAKTIPRLGQAIPAPAQANDSVFLRDGSTARFVPWREVQHIVVEGNYSRVHFDNGPPITLIRSLRQWIDLAPPSLFTQVHRTALVRIDTIRKVVSSTKDRHEIVLSDATRLEVGRTFWTHLKARLSLKG